ncbi:MULTISPECIES: amidohydrolase family protein [unclassified Bacillus (in: firmicutes)]|uniref:amidohydrolase family protein n=1 Tax=unclassified Bacillus (in: firmicutes) TaxID=185979 RepID=UPI0008EE1839|nr:MULTISPECIES: amidohydrolase family protein [unclassified Bacillus (in: firmicutes)]SFA86153.1 5-methylthioadenosine/S-adenosylhomocysteine deaminase [Bacillus sp. UNCCL13]SFQ83599.1 5-methylthioadenosine/S-adenosylhomocysteine deaminase [Bacillus sp. cl95]
MLLKNVTYLNSEMKFEKGEIAINEGSIHLNTVESNDSEVFDCSEYLVIPGLINAHFHSYSSIAKGLMKEMKIQDWCNDSEQGRLQNHLFEYLDTNLLDEEFVWIGQQSYVDMIKNGVTFVSDSDPGNDPALLAQAINKLGIRGMVDTYARFPELLSRKDGNVSYGAHLLEEEDITEETLLECVKNKKNYDSIFMTHCMENGWRKDLVYSSFNKSSVELYKEYGLLDHKTILFHGVHMSENDMELAADAESSVVHCPISNLWSGAGQANVKEMLRRKVNVCLGTDYAHTDMWEVMRMAYYLLKLNTDVSEFSAEAIFKMATVNGACAYQLHNEIGQIKEGYKADLVFIKKDAALQPLVQKGNFTNYLHNLLTNMKSEFIQHVMVDGKWVMKDKEILNVDEELVRRRYLEIVERIFA